MENEYSIFQMLKKVSYSSKAEYLTINSFLMFSVAVPHSLSKNGKLICNI